MWMNNPVQITNGEWNQVTQSLSENTKDIHEQEERLNRHANRIQTLENNTKDVPYAIQKAVSDGMEKVLTKVMEHDQKFHSLEMEKIQERALASEQRLKELSEAKKYYFRNLIGVLISSGLGGIIGYYVMKILNG